MNAVLIKNAKAIVSCDERDRVYFDSDLLIQGPAVKAIGKDLQAPRGAEVIDARGMLVYPGLVNTHHHFFQTFVRSISTIDYPSMTVPEWIDKIYRIFQNADDEVIYYSTVTAFADLIKHGCTTAFDHQYCYTHLTGKAPVDRQMEAARLLGIRYHAGRGANTLPRELGSVIPENMVESTEEFLGDCERIIDKYHDPAPFSMGQIVISPCQPMNCYEETFREAAALARRKGVFMHTHLGEGENPVMVERYGRRTLEWAEDIGFAGPDVFYAHCWELTEDEFARMARAGTGVSHCPMPAILGGFPIIPIKKLLDMGVNVGLGCDGSATNDSSNLLDTMRAAYVMQCFRCKERGEAASAYDILKTATIGGAKLLGRADIGSLEEGKAADLFMVNGDALELCGTEHAPKDLLARSGVCGNTALTMINGKVVCRNGVLEGIDEAALKAEGAKVHRAFLKRSNIEI